MGLVGCGAVAVGRYIPALEALNEAYEVLAVCDPDKERCLEAGRRLGLPPQSCYADNEELIDRPDIGAVIIATPPHVHSEVAKRAAERHKHVLVEKPISTRPITAWAAIEAADQAGVHFGIMHNYLHFPEYRAIKGQIVSGSIGRVSTVIINALSVTDNRGAAGDGTYNWRHDPTVAGGGVLMDMIHLVYVAEYLLGEPLERVSAYVDPLPGQEEVEKLALCRFEGSGCAALVNVGWGNGPGGVLVNGEKGFLSVRYRGGGTSPFAPLEQVTLSREGVETEIHVEQGERGFRAILSDFARSIAEGRNPLVGGAAGARALEATLGAYASAAWRETVSLPLVRESDIYKLGLAGIWKRGDGLER